MHATPTAKRYSAATALHFVWSGDEVAISNAKHLEEVWKAYNFEVIQVDEKDLGVKRRQKDAEMDEKAKSWFLDWLHENWLAPEEDCEPGDEDKLLVVCYFGHGTSDGPNWQHNRLSAIKEGGRPFYDFTALQEAAVGACDADLLFIFECCEGHEPGMGDEPEYVSEDRVVELLCAGIGTIHMEGDERDFTRRLASNLRNHRGPYSVEERFGEVKEESEDSGAPGVYRRESSDSRSVGIVLQPV